MKVYKVIYKTYVVAEDDEEAEQIAREMNLTIQDPSVKANKITISLESKTVEAAEKLITNLFQIPGMDSFKAYDILKQSLSISQNISDEILDALYYHCERIYLHNYAE